MLKKNLLMLSVSVMFAVALVAPSAALAQFGPPPGPPPAFAGPLTVFRHFGGHLPRCRRQWSPS